MGKAPKLNLLRNEWLCRSILFIINVIEFQNIAEPGEDFTIDPPEAVENEFQTAILIDSKMISFWGI